MNKVLRANTYFLIILLLEILGPMILAPIFLNLKLPLIGALVLNHIIIFIIPAIIYFIVTKESVKDTLRLNPISFNEGALAVLIGILSQPILIFLSTITSFFFRNDTAIVMNEMSSAPYIILLLAVAVMPAITEEITLRGIILKGYDKKSKIKAAIVIGFMFGMFHLTTSQFLYTALLGGVFAYMVRTSNSIFVASIAHFTINGLQVTIQKLSGTVSTDSIIEASNTILNFPIWMKVGIGAFWAVIAILFTFFIFIAIKKLKKLANKRGVVDTYYREEENVKDRIFDISFILSIIVYFLYMTIFI
ncbi:CPBP family intramembrane glutamic endopeptidase [Clostridium fallax]|uniref:CAAX prenyl protease 2/Lysostaphin resistance protein A-like domain-containing protein n=1 Tax=Clostridium fallax TaxID=1533 RepID=A0A1M4YUM4_9CLOT|nr:CPBP family intramembrane glutamic endopeptidase [Clostridium fallax]SHF09470.1 hypothetical protein SAMN05443638_13221 [Clostridium fallax]SQB22170.1 caax amino protease family protein [Clostridium fallax]